MSANPSNFFAELKKGGKSLVSVDIDKEVWRLNYAEKISEQELFDGMHVIETSMKDPAEDVLDIYKGLWHIESNFRVLKSQLEGRPVYKNRKPYPGSLSLLLHLISHLEIVGIQT